MYIILYNIYTCTCVHARNIHKNVCIGVASFLNIHTYALYIQNKDKNNMMTEFKHVEIVLFPFVIKTL